MSSYESLRNDLIGSLAGKLQPDQLRSVLTALDLTSAGYDIAKKTTDLSVPGELPEVVKIYLASKSVENLSIGTLKQYRYKLIDFFSAVRKPYTDISSNDIRLYLYHFKESRGISDCYVDNVRRALNAFFEWLVLNDYLLRNPCAKIPHIKYQYKERVALSAYDLEVVRWVCQDVRDKALVDFLYSTGCRVSELTAVEKSDIDWQLRSVRIRHGKGDKARTVFFNAESELTLRKYLESRSDKDPHLFVTLRAPHKLTTRAVQAIIRKIRERTGLKAHVTPHVLRHTFATSGIRRGLPLEQLQALMGHSKPETTLIYAKVDTTDLQRAHQQIYSA